jgi:hypothetical protein
MRTGHSSAGLYEIRVQGRLEPRWAVWFESFTLTPGPEGTTVLRGTVVDQAALHGLLQSLRDLGLPLVSVTQTETAVAITGAGADAQPTLPAQEDSR